MFCPRCGAKNEDSARFCLKCGRPLAVSAPEPTRPGRQRFPWVILAVGVVIFLAGGALGWFLWLGPLIQDKKGARLAGGASPPPRTTPTVEANASPLAATEVTPTLPLPSPSTTIAKPTMPPTLTPLPTATSPATATPPPTATPQPTATPLPTPTPSVTASPTLAPPTDTPRPSCKRAQKGLIGFRRQARCDKRGGSGCGPVEIWMMNADGSNQAPMCNPQVYDWGLVRDRTSPDGQWRVEVTGGDIMRLYTTGRRDMLIVNNGMDFDPVLSADGWWLAWVSERNGNDEIYIKTVDFADQNQRRLTVNGWEWDKHPSWSPDGRQIAFYSNRASSLTEATRQIWVMEVVNDQGVNLRNLSRRPDKVDTDPVWFKWDEMP